jgi:hypothetical protein
VLFRYRGWADCIIATNALHSSRKGHNLLQGHNVGGRSVAVQAMGATFQVLRCDLAVPESKLSCELPPLLA